MYASAIGARQQLPRDWGLGTGGDEGDEGVWGERFLPRPPTPPIPPTLPMPHALFGQFCYIRETTAPVSSSCCLRISAAS